MTRLIYFSLFMSLTYCLDQDAFDLKVKYLDDLINTEIKKAENYKFRLDNSDLLGQCGKCNEVLDYGSFDFIVVGGGSSGSVVVNRLTEVEQWKVLLLEAGDVNDDFTDIPYVFDVSGTSDRNWGYLTVPQKNGCYGRNGKQCPYIRGKILGGSGSLNGLVYARGIKYDFDKWANAGNPGWSWKECLHYYKKIENFQSESIDLNYRGFAGPINVVYVKPWNPLQEAFFKANEEIGIPYIEDYNAEKVNGVSSIQHNLQNGRRVSGATNYIKPASNRINFNITLQAYVTKVLITADTKTAYGVEFVKNGKKYRALAKKEVIVSGGSVNSPQLLMLSGIGPKSELQQHGISVIQDLPVGKFMKDHIGHLGFYLSSNYTEPVVQRNTLIRQYLRGEGLYTAPSHYRGISFFNSRNRSAPVPNMEIDFVPPSAIKANLPQFSNYKDEIRTYVNGVNKSSSWNFQLYYLHPKSVGTLTLKSGDPKDFPLIDSKIFDEVEDLEDMYQGILVALKMLDTSVGKKYNLTLELNIPSCNHNKKNSRSYWYCILRQMALPAYHLSSTCKMGPKSDPLAVVDHELKVHGIKNLRVIDVSVVPNTVSGHINAQAFVVGEKGADMIKSDHLGIVKE